ncbi:MAG: hypothetical protein HC773_14155 [Scytonema sp. CRU_2_7]|nr:hypothetical protein [Scytonema sp. CRU_2_7]
MTITTGIIIIDATIPSTSMTATYIVTRTDITVTGATITDDALILPGF